MKHYFLRIKENKFLVVDTFDLTEEEAEFCDIVPHITDSFINAFYSSRDLSEEYKKGTSLDRILPSLKTPAYSFVSGHFIFDIKQGYVSYNGLYIEIYFYGKRHIIQPVYTNIDKGDEKVWFILSDKTILNKVQCRIDKTTFIIKDIFVCENRLCINISMTSYKSFQIVLDYNTKCFSVKTLRGKEKDFPISISDYLHWANNKLLRNESDIDNTFASPRCITNVLESYFSVGISLEKEDVLAIVDTLLECISRGRLNYNDYKHPLTLIDSFVGLTQEQKIKLTKYKFLKERGY